MPTFQFSFKNPSDLLTALHGYQEASVDPAFDSDMDELERQFQELRFASLNQ